MTELLIDAGNSRIKWAQRNDGELGAMGELTHAIDPAIEDIEQRAHTLFDDAWGSLEAPKAVAVSSVANPALVRHLTTWAKNQWGETPHVARSQARWDSLRNAYEDPQSLGVDRWLAMVAGWALCRGTFAAVDAGTALTVDVVADDGRHLGGWIAPGRALLHGSLDRRTAQVRPPVLDSSGEFGQDTAGCVAGGVASAVRGVLDQLLQRIPAGTPILLCGGDAPWAGQWLPDHQWHPDLVLRGLGQWLDHERAA